MFGTDAQAHFLFKWGHEKMIEVFSVHKIHTKIYMYFNTTMYINDKNIMEKNYHYDYTLFHRCWEDCFPCTLFAFSLLGLYSSSKHYPLIYQAPIMTSCQSYKLYIYHICGNTDGVCIWQFVGFAFKLSS